MLIFVSDIYTVKHFLRSEFTKQNNPDVAVKLANVIELIDLLDYNEFGYKIEYKQQIRIIKARKPVLENKILF